MPNKKNKGISVRFSFSIISVWGEHMNHEGDNLDWKFVPTSSKQLWSGHYKVSILAYDKLCVQKAKRNIAMRPLSNILSIYNFIQQT